MWLVQCEDKKFIQKQPCEAVNTYYYSVKGKSQRFLKELLWPFTRYSVPVVSQAGL